MEISNELLWLIAGGIMILSEFLIIPGVGFLFAGLAALIVGLLASFGLLDVTWQWISFCILTIVSAILLWKPLKNYKSPNESKPFTDMEGQKAVVIGTLEPGKHGQAKWSGTVMKAKLDESATSSIAEGKEAVIVRVEGNILILK